MMVCFSCGLFLTGTTAPPPDVPSASSLDYPLFNSIKVSETNDGHPDNEVMDDDSLKKAHYARESSARNQADKALSSILNNKDSDALETFLENDDAYEPEADSRQAAWTRKSKLKMKDKHAAYPELKRLWTDKCSAQRRSLRAQEDLLAYPPNAYLQQKAEMAKSAADASTEAWEMYNEEINAIEELGA